MEDESIQEKIKEAEKAVENVKDPNLKSKAFEVVLNKLLNENMGAPETGGFERNESPKIEGGNDFQRLCQVTGLRKEQLEQIFEFDGSNFAIIGNVPGKGERQKQQNASVIMLTVRNYLQGDKEIKALELKKCLADIGIGSLTNLAANLKAFENYLLQKEKANTRDTTYRITAPGITKGLELIKTMAGGKNE